MVLMLGGGLSCNSDGDGGQDGTETCPSPIGIHLTLGSQDYCGLIISDMRDFRVFVDTENEIWTAERTVSDTYEYTNGQFNRFDQLACRTTVINGFTRAFRNQDDVRVQVELSYDLQLGATEVFGLAQVRVLCDPAGACGAAYVGGECLFTANVNGTVYCTGDDCQPLDQSQGMNDGGMTEDGGITADGGISPDMGTPPSERCPQSDRVLDAKGITWVCIEGGTFIMGDNSGPFREQPEHEVTVPTFWMMQSEVTVAHYRNCRNCQLPGNSTNLTNNETKRPINGLTLGEMTAFITELNEQEAGAHRLPSEAEWEYAATSRGQQALPWSQDETPGGREGSADTCTEAVGHTLQGLCDMLGNVSEVLEDDYHATYNCNQNFDAAGCATAEPLVAPTDGSAWVDPAPRGNRRVKRGGSYLLEPVQLSATDRGWIDNSVNSSRELGFRLVRSTAPDGEDVSCGNGVLNNIDACDDGNRVEDDGCDARCRIEPGYTCNGEPSICAPTMPNASTLDFITIEGGTFQMGSNQGDPDEQPMHSVTLPAFDLMRTEVTVGQYRVCVDAGVCSVPEDNYPQRSENRENHPITNISWQAAQVYAAFIGARLPSAAEWEYAARSRGQNIQYPWGNMEPACDLLNFNNCRTGTTPTCSYENGHSSQSICDLAGNVFEWVEDDPHDDYMGAPTDGSAWIDTPRSNQRMFLGGAWNHDGRFARVSNRGNTATQDDEFAFVGFRLARNAPPCATTPGGCPELDFVSIEGGSFEMGSESDSGNLTRESPDHSVTVNDFKIMRTEVKVAQYRFCVEAGVCTAPTQGNYVRENRDNHPINYVSWNDIQPFLAFVGARLPTEAEWEFAARSRGADNEFPWGSEMPSCTLLNFNKCVGEGGDTTEVCSYEPGLTAQGLCDMGGNVWEWLEDDYHETYNGAPEDGSAWIDIPRGEHRVIRGGSADHPRVNARTRYRDYFYPNQGADYFFGFRLARD